MYLDNPISVGIDVQEMNKKSKTLQIGSRVRLVSDRYTDSDSNPRWGGRCGQIMGTIDGGEVGDWSVKWDNGNTNSDYSERDLELASGKKGRPAKDPKTIPFSFVLQYDRDEDPIELYRTMAEVKARVAYLIENDRYVKRESFKVYEIKGLPKTIKVSTSVKLSK